MSNPGTIYTNIIENNGVQYILAHDINKCACIYINNGIWYCKELDFSIINDIDAFEINKVSNKLYIITNYVNNNELYFNIA